MAPPWIPAAPNTSPLAGAADPSSRFPTWLALSAPTPLESPPGNAPSSWKRARVHLPDCLPCSEPLAPPLQPGVLSSIVDVEPLASGFCLPGPLLPFLYLHQLLAYIIVWIMSACLVAGVVPGLVMLISTTLPNSKSTGHPAKRYEAFLGGHWTAKTRWWDVSHVSKASGLCHAIASSFRCLPFALESIRGCRTSCLSPSCSSLPLFYALRRPPPLFRSLPRLDLSAPPRPFLLGLK